MDLNSENRVIALVLDGNVNKYELLVLKYQGAVFNLMLRMTGSRDDAMDLAQDTFVRAYEKLDKFKAGKKFFPWLYAIGMNLARDWLRAKKPDHLPLMDMVPEVDGSETTYVDPDWYAAIAVREVEQEMLKLSPALREAVILRFREDLTVKEVAQALGIGVSSAKMRISRGLESLRAGLANGGGHEQGK